MSDIETGRIVPAESATVPSQLNSFNRLLRRYGSVDAFRAAAPLPKNTQELIDKTVLSVALDELVIVKDLIAEGLTYDLPNWLAVPQLYWEMSSTAGRARRSMIPKTRGENQLPDRTGVTIPIYCTLSNFELGIREQLASERAGAPLDTTMIEEETQRVNEAIEDAVINGSGLQVAGSTAPGLLNAPSGNSYTYVGGEKWDAAGKTGAEIVTDVLAMMALARADGRKGPYNLYVSTVYGHTLNQNYSDGVTTFDYTIRERLERIVAGGRTIRVREADKLPEDTTILLQMTRNVIDVVYGQAPAVITWEDGPGLERYWLVLACIVPRVKTTYDSQSGIVVGTNA
jgi:uncharacterized linocin/CFP29 family protein